MPTVRTLAAAVVALAAASPALAQMRPEAPGVTYRDGMPAVNAPAPVAAPDAANSQASAGFARWYAAAGRPSILLFWNRELIEDATTMYDNVQSSAAIGAARSDAASVAGAGGYAVGGYGAAAGESVRYGAGSRSSAAMVATESRQYQERSTDSRYAIADPTYGHGVESAISSTLISAGAKIVSREALMRKVSTGKTKEDRLDIQLQGRRRPPRRPAPGREVHHPAHQHQQAGQVEGVHAQPAPEGQHGRAGDQVGGRAVAIQRDHGGESHRPQADPEGVAPRPAHDGAHERIKQPRLGQDAEGEDGEQEHDPGGRHLPQALDRHGAEVGPVAGQQAEGQGGQDQGRGGREPARHDQAGEDRHHEESGQGGVHGRGPPAEVRRRPCGPPRRSRGPPG